MNISPDQFKAQLRQHFLASRCLINDIERAYLDAQICAHVLDVIKPGQSESIAAYLSFKGEPNLKAALTVLAKQECALCLPVLKDKNMQFRAWQPDIELVPNRHGILEPAAGHVLEPHALDIVLMPLVAYDETGGRLGMGGGYYDRSFAFRRSDEVPVSPRLIGIAYSIQQASGQSLPMEDWDVRLDAVITENGWQEFNLKP